MNRKGTVIWLSLLVMLNSIIIIDIIPDFTISVRGATFYVNETGSGGAFTSIQHAINYTQDGDTVFIYSGIYHEDVVINKTINLTGENKNTTIINGSGYGDVIKVEADWVNVSGIYLRNGSSYAIHLLNVSNVTLRDMSIFGRPGNIAIGGRIGVKIDGSSNITINDSLVVGGQGSDSEFSPGGYGGDGIWGINSDDIRIIDSVVFGGDGGNSSFDEGGDGGIGIRFYNCSSLKITSNNVSGGQGGIGGFGGNGITQHAIGLASCSGIIEDNNLTRSWYGICFWTSSSVIARGNILYNNGAGIGFHDGSSPCIENNLFINNKYGIRGYNDGFGGTAIPTFFNNTIINSTLYDISIGGDYSHPILINTTFNKTSVQIADSSTLTVKWFLTVNVKDMNKTPVEGAIVWINDTFGTNIYTSKTDIYGKISNIIITEYIQTSSTTTYYTPHNITAMKGADRGFVITTIDWNTEITIIFNYSIYLKSGWNLVSIPLIQVDQNLKKVLEMIDGFYDAVQRYNVTDIKNPWKHHKVGKPYGNDLSKINETMGFWIHITQPGDTIFLYNGTQPTSNQTIILHPGWNLVGYPSITSYNRTAGLNNLTFGQEVNSIWTYYAATQKWKEISPSGYFELGRGYWIHAKTTCVWEVPL